MSREFEYAVKALKALIDNKDAIVSEVQVDYSYGRVAYKVTSFSFVDTVPHGVGILFELDHHRIPFMLVRCKHMYTASVEAQYSVSLSHTDTFNYGTALDEVVFTSTAHEDPFLIGMRQITFVVKIFGDKK